MDMEDAATTKLDAAMPVSLFGQMHSVKEMEMLKSKMFVIEDAAQSFGATNNGIPSGKLANISCFSFYPTKTLGAYGDAGAILTDDKHLAQEARLLANHSLSAPYIHSGSGTNSRLDEIQAAILMVKLELVVDKNIARKAEIASMYNEDLDRTKVRVPKKVDGGFHCYHQYTVRLKDRDAVKDALAREGIESQVYYPVPIADMPGFDRYIFSSYDETEETRKLCSEVLSLPIDAYMSNDEVYYVIETLNRVAGGYDG